MNIAEKFAQKKLNEKQKEEVKRQEKVRALAKKIIVTLKDEETVESLESYLVEHGSLSITDFGCLCQGGFCDWQKGLNELLQPLVKEWSVKGVIIRPSLKLDFHVKTSGLSFYRREMSIEQLKKWNKSQK